MDSILIIGPLDSKVTDFLKKAGYRVLQQSGSQATPEIMREEFLDLAVIEAGTDKLAHEWVEFLRTQESTRDIPIVVLSPDKLQTLQVKELAYDKIEVLQAPYALGTVISKIATSLRLRKMSGRNEEKATLAEVNAALRDLNEYHQKELQDARDIQKSLLPKELPTGSTFEAAAVYDPLDKVGGDFYTIEYTSSRKLRLLSADVTGHGISAAFLGSMTKLALVATNKEDPGDLLQAMNSLMAPILPQGRFVTANAYLYDPESRMLTFARAGGPAAALFTRETGEVRELKGDGFPLGFFEEGEYPSEKTQMSAGDVLVVVTDGITEGQNRDKAFFGFEGIAQAIKKNNAQDSAAMILESIQQSFRSFMDGRILKDDVTILVLKAL